MNHTTNEPAGIDLDSERKLFEAVEAARGTDLSKAWGFGSQGEYANPFVENRWQGWQLSLARRAPAPASAQPNRGAAQAVQIFACKGKGGEYELIGYSNGAGPKRGESIVVYCDTTKPDILYHRSADDFRDRMEWLGARAPSPASQPVVPEAAQAFPNDGREPDWAGYAAAEAAHAQQEAAQAVPSNASVKDMLRWLGVDTDYHGKIAFTLGQFARFVGMLRAATVAPSDAKDVAPTTVLDHSEREAANAGGLDAPIMANGVPVEQTQMDWVCRFISENSIFDGSDILRAWNELVTFYVAHRAAATIAAGQEAASAKDAALSTARTALASLLSEIGDYGRPNVRKEARSALKALDAAMAAVGAAGQEGGDK